MPLTPSTITEYIQSYFESGRKLTTVFVSLTVVQRKRKGCDSSLSVARCLSVFLLFFYRRNAAGWILGEVHIFTPHPQLWRMIHRQLIFSQVRLVQCCSRWWCVMSLQQRPSALQPAHIYHIVNVTVCVEEIRPVLINTRTDHIRSIDST